MLSFQIVWKPLEVLILRHYQKTWDGEIMAAWRQPSFGGSDSSIRAALIASIKSETEMPKLKFERLEDNSNDEPVLIRLLTSNDGLADCSDQLGDFAVSIAAELGLSQANLVISIIFELNMLIKFILNNCSGCIPIIKGWCIC